MAADDTKYVDGEVVRAGPEGSHGTGAFSSGRGGTPGANALSLAAPSGVGAFARGAGLLAPHQPFSTPRCPHFRKHGTISANHSTDCSARAPGAGNIADAKSQPAPRADKDLVPEEAYRPSTEGQDYHVGRGGAGNAVETDKPAAHKDIDHEKKAAAQARAEGHSGVSVADKLKAKILAPFHKK
ncbi:hypothetical protein ColLi_03038 [Colletotrichum liriopes]|uniref:Uncharacterized protein n=1 Tax=Colletotrichum liriopes TaxID=708192 RepID=A0AA37LPD3_9PEZI|nr:hypothetical protein ColLi_03038 [Colletotrichum liriopes]